VNGPPDTQDAVILLPVPVADVQETPIADAGTVVQPVNVVEFA
jgi:hypothetical protein